jgi:hypothetical protein
MVLQISGSSEGHHAADEPLGFPNLLQSLLGRPVRDLVLVFLDEAVEQVLTVLVETAAFCQYGFIMLGREVLTGLQKQVVQ